MTEIEESNYRVNVVRSGDWWAIEVPELPGTFSQVRRLDQVEDAAREAIAMMTDTSESEFIMDVHIESGPDIDALLAALKESVAAAKAAREREGADRRAVIEELRSKGLPNRDVAKLIGLSHQRVAQILKAS